MRRKTVSRLVLIALLSSMIFGLVIGCAGSGITHDRAALVIRSTFNDYVEDYLAYRNALPAGPEREAIRGEIEPKLNTIARLLSAYDLAIGSPSEAAAYDEATKALEGLINDLVRKGISKLK